MSCPHLPGAQPGMLAWKVISNSNRLDKARLRASREPERGTEGSGCIQVVHFAGLWLRGGDQQGRKAARWRGGTCTSAVPPATDLITKSPPHTERSSLSESPTTCASVLLGSAADGVVRSRRSASATFYFCTARRNEADHFSLDVRKSARGGFRNQLDDTVELKAIVPSISSLAGIRITCNRPTGAGNTSEGSRSPWQYAGSG